MSVLFPLKKVKILRGAFLFSVSICVKFEGCVSLGSMSLLRDSRGGEEEEEVKKKTLKNEQKQEVFRAVARTPKKKHRTKTRGVPSCSSNT